MQIGIVGLGYVGLPLSLQFAASGVSVVGLDIDPSKVEAINAGRSYIKHIEAAGVQSAVEKGLFKASTDFSAITTHRLRRPSARRLGRDLLCIRQPRHLECPRSLHGGIP